MSHIPNSAMPHAGPQTTDEDSSSSSESGGRFSQLAEKVRENPKTAMAAGAAVAAGIVAAAAIPVIRSRSGGSSGKSGKKDA